MLASLLHDVQNMRLTAPNLKPRNLALESIHPSVDNLHNVFSGAFDIYSKIPSLRTRYQSRNLRISVLQSQAQKRLESLHSRQRLSDLRFREMPSR